MELKNVIEVLLFHAQKALTAEELRTIIVDTAKNVDDEYVKAFKKTTVEQINEVLEQIQREVNEANRPYRLMCVAGAWQYASRPEYAPWLRSLFGLRQRPPRLSQPALETLAIIAYRQPVTRAEIEQIRGVSVDGVIQTLLERGLIEQTGRAEVAGRPALYSTTNAFLEYFGLRSLDDLPAADELRRVPVQRPDTLLTVDQTQNSQSASPNIVSTKPQPDQTAVVTDQSQEKNVQISDSINSQNEEPQTQAQKST